MLAFLVILFNIYKIKPQNVQESSTENSENLKGNLT